MRLPLFLAVLLVAGCDTGTTSADLDLGSFTGYDAQADLVLNGSAFHRATLATALTAPTYELRIDASAGDGPVYAIRADVPFRGPFEVATDTGVNATISRGGGPIETTSGAVVEITSVRPSGDYVELEGTVTLPFAAGVVTGDFRAVDGNRPVPGRDCTPLDCSTY